MSDLIERLRDIRRGQILQDGSYVSVADLCRDAADEIARLRKCLDTLKVAYDRERRRSIQISGSDARPSVFLDERETHG